MLQDDSEVIDQEIERMTRLLCSKAIAGETESVLVISDLLWRKKEIRNEINKQKGKFRLKSLLLSVIANLLPYLCSARL